VRPVRNIFVNLDGDNDLVDIDAIINSPLVDIDIDLSDNIINIDNNIFTGRPRPFR
jgi:hypothetical protein